MRSKSKRLALVGAGLLMTATTFVVVQNQAGAADPPPPDKVVLNLGLGNNSSPSYWRWTPGSADSPFPTTFTQSITGGGGCADPNFGSSTPLVLLGAEPANLGAIPTAYNGRMGVCHINPNFAIDPGETLIFKIGTAAPMVDRSFSKVDLSLQQLSNQFPNNGTWKLQATLFFEGDLVGTQQISHSGNSPVLKTIQQVSGGGVVNFDELRLATVAPVSGAAPSIAVSGGTSKQPLQTTFYLNDLLCPGETITAGFSQGGSQVTQAVAENIGTVCKSYAAFIWVDGKPNDPTLPDAPWPPAHLVFDTPDVDGDARVRISIDWGLFDECVPNADESAGAPACKVTFVNTFDPDEWNPQTFCASAPGHSGEPWCTVEKTYTYETVGTVTKTRITEVWEGFGDPWFW